VKLSVCSPGASGSSFEPHFAQKFAAAGFWNPHSGQ